MPNAPLHHPLFCNPHEGLELKRLNVDTSLQIHNFIKRIRINEGTNTNTVNLLLQKIYDALILRNITDFTSVDEFERFVAECIIVHPSEIYFKLESSLHLNEQGGIDKRSISVLKGSPQLGTGTHSLHGGTSSRPINSIPDGSNVTGRTPRKGRSNAGVTHKSSKLLRGDKTGSGGVDGKKSKDSKGEKDQVGGSNIGTSTGSGFQENRK